MDKYEYKIRSEEILELIDKEKYAEAAKVADVVDWRRVKSITMLLKIAALYRINRRNEDSRAVLQLAYDRYPANRSVVYSLCEVAIELDDVVAAIEYYKQFVKLAPRDNGVYTLRYRILEAQEASLEERIELLEELKKRDYQEEWAYELAYLYHRVGLATKCIEECDDIILWFGDGSYVMKAMELKMLHTSLTAVQQTKYVAMQNSPDGTYMDYEYNDSQQDNDSYDNYSETNYGTDTEYYSAQGYAEQGYTNEEYNGQGYVEQGYANEEYNGQGYAEQGYANEEYNGQGYAEQGYTNEEYNGQGYVEQGYANEEYNGQDYVEQGYVDNYQQESYRNSDATSYVEDMSQYNTINLQKVVAEGMKELQYIEESYFDNVNQDDSPGDNVSSENISDTNQIYDVVNDDAQNIEDDNSNDNLSWQDEQESIQGFVHTGKIALMEDGVSEENPLPNTGAIKKVILPGDNARIIKEESSIDEIRDITENAVYEEQTRIQDNDENVYHSDDYAAGEYTEYEKDDLRKDAFKPVTGQIKVDRVLAEWEKIKQENAQKHQEEIRQRVLQQTGKIFADFDNSVKSGILGELAEEEAQIAHITSAETKAENTEKGISVVEHIINELSEDAVQISEEEVREYEDNFLEADVTSNIPQDEIESVVSLEAESDIDNVIVTDEMAEVSEGNIAEFTNQEDDQYGEVEEIEDYIEMSEEMQDQEVIFEQSEDENTLSDAQEQIYEDTEYIEDQIYEDAEYTEDQVYETDEYVEEQAYEADEHTEGQAYEYAENQVYETDEYAENQMNEAEEYIEDLYEQDVQNNVSINVKDEKERQIDPEEAEIIAEIAKEDALKTQEIKMNTAELSSLSEKILATTKKETKGAKRDDIREFTPEEQSLFENFAVTKKIKKQILFALDKMTLAAYTGNVIITGEAGLDTVKMAKNLIKDYQATDANFSGKIAKITGEKINTRNIKEVFDKLSNGAIIIEKANGMNEDKLYEMAVVLNQENVGIIVIMEDTKKEITKLFEKQAMLADYFNIRIDLMEMDNNALVAYAKNYALALEYSIDELGVLALYTRIANIQSGNHVVTKDEVRDIIDEAIWKSKRFKIKNFVDILFARRYDSDDMIVLKERDFI